jgi:hypothetical protein
VDDKDTFLTVSYRGGFIHTCYNRTRGVGEVSYQLYEGDKNKRTRSVRGAKQQIGRYLANKG